MFKAFVSHSDADEELVRFFCEHMNNRIPFISFKYVMHSDRPGLDFMNEVIAPMIIESDFFIVFYTKKGMRSAWVNQELGFAVANNKYIIPIIDEELSGTSVGLLHSNIARFDLSDEGDADEEAITYSGYLAKRIEEIMHRIEKWSSSVFDQEIDEISNKIEHYKKEEDFWFTAVNYSKMAAAFLSNNSYDLALQYYDKALKDYSKQDDATWEIAVTYHRIADIYLLKLSDKRASINTLQEAAKWHIKDATHWEAAEVFKKAGDLLLEHYGVSVECKDQYKRAIAQYEKAEAFYEVKKIKNKIQNLS